MNASPPLPPLSLSTRLLLAWRTFFAILLHPSHAQKVLALSAGSSLPAARATQPDTQPSARADQTASDGALPGSAFDAPALGALRLLRLLQREARFVDFVQQDVTGFPDADVGAAARIVHRGCREVLGRQVTLRVVSTVPEEERVSLEDASQVRAGHWKLTGNLSAGPPHRGVVKHAGWKVERLQLPEPVGNDDPSILCPAELEVS